MPIQKLMDVHQVNVSGIQAFFPFDVGCSLLKCRIAYPADMLLIGTNLIENELFVVIRAFISRRTEQLNRHQLHLRIMRQSGKCLNVILKFFRFLRAFEYAVSIFPRQLIGQPASVENLPDVIGEHFLPEQAVDILLSVAVITIMPFQRADNLPCQPHIHHFQRPRIGKLIRKCHQLVGFLVAESFAIFQRQLNLVLKKQPVFL